VDKWIRAQVKAFRQGQALRMSLHLRIQHVCFAASVTALAVTGLSLMLGDSDFGRWLVASLGGFHFRGVLHRVAAGGLIACFVYHFGYLIFSSEGRSEFGERLIRRRDLGNFFKAFRHGLRPSSEPPHIGKYSLGQKLHYWLSGLLTGAMIASGLALWNPTATMAILPAPVVHLLLAVHSNQALLVVVLVVLWHLYDAHLGSGRFPMSAVWLTGRMPVDKLKSRHRDEYERLKRLAEDEDA